MRLVLATVAAFLALAAPAAAKTEVATAGDVRAELSYVKVKDYPYAKRVRLRVLEGGDVVSERSFKARLGLTPIGVNAGTKSVRLRDLDGDGDVEALFDLFTGGAHCCEVTYLYDGGPLTTHNWADPGYVLKDLDGDGVPEFRTADARFQYLFGSFAASYPPVRVLHYADGRFRAVTADYPALVRRDARDARREYRRAVRKTRKDPQYRELVRSTLAAYVADRCALGDCRGGYDLVVKTVRAGLVGPGYSRRLQTLLERFGYDS